MSDTPPPDHKKTPGNTTLLTQAEDLSDGVDKPYIWQRRWFQIMLAGVLVYMILGHVVPGALRALNAVSSVFVPVLVGLSLAYVVNPLLRFAGREAKIGRLAGTLSVMLLVLVVVAPAVTLMTIQGGKLVLTLEDLPDYFTEVIDEVKAEWEQAPTPPDAVTTAPEPPPASADGDGPKTAKLPGWLIEPLRGLIHNERIRPLLESGLDRLRKIDFSEIDWTGLAWRFLGHGKGALDNTLAALGFTGYLALSTVVTAFCFFFFSWKFDAILAWFEPYIPERSRDHTLDILRKMDLAVASFVRGRLIQSLIMGVLLCVGWWITGVPFWFLLGVVTGALNIVPFLPMAGWLVAIALTVVTTLSGDGGFALGLVVWPTVVYFAVQSLDGYVIEPVVQGKATNLDPLSVMLAVLVGGALAGLLGMLLAIPLAACIKILMQEMVLPRLREAVAEL